MRRSVNALAESSAHAYDSRCSARRRLTAGAICVFVLVGPVRAGNGDQPVSISGGVNEENRQMYTWTVANRHTAPIVFIEFPHFHGDLFTPPAGWSQEWKNKSAIGGGENAPGWVRTGVQDPGKGIPAGGSATFGMRVSRTGALSRPGSVKVRFADGTEVLVGQVEVPSAQSFIEQNIMVIGMAVIFVIAVLLHLRSRRKAGSSSGPSPLTAENESG